MKLEQSFDVVAEIDRVWAALTDVARVAPCLPGAEITSRNEDGTYNGSFKVKIGPTSAAYTGKLSMESLDEPGHRAAMQANGTDKRGQGGAKATIVSTLSAAPGGGTTVHVDTDYTITGRLARFGRGGMIEDISQRLLREFAERLQAMLAEDPAAGAAADPPEAPGAGDPPGTTAAPAPPPPTRQEVAAEGTPANEISGLSLAGGVLAGRIRSNPLPLLGGLLAVWLLLRRRR